MTTIPTRRESREVIASRAEDVAHPTIFYPEILYSLRVYGRRKKDRISCAPSSLGTPYINLWSIYFGFFSNFLHLLVQIYSFLSCSEYVIRSTRAYIIHNSSPPRLLFLLYTFFHSKSFGKVYRNNQLWLLQLKSKPETRRGSTRGRIGKIPLHLTKERLN